MRKRMAELREQAMDLRSLADQLVARTEGVGWTGRAADALALRIRERAVQVRDVAARHETAAESLDAHAAEVDRLKDAIAAAERRAERLTEDRAERGAGNGVGGRVRDEAGAGANCHNSAFAPPPPGHKDWLAVDLPGM
ncbi:hypothetical protein [Nocardioides hungaricus]